MPNAKISQGGELLWRAEAWARLAEEQMRMGIDSTTGLINSLRALSAQPLPESALAAMLGMLEVCWSHKVDARVKALLVDGSGAAG